MTIKVELTNKPDADALSSMHTRCFEKGWDAATITSLLAVAGTVAFVAPDSGFGLLRHVGDDAEILTLAVLPEQRQRGVGAAIVAAMHKHAQAQGAKALFLEVSERNVAAYGLYAGQGFSVISRRNEYYQNADGTRDHALIMRLTFGKTPQTQQIFNISRRRNSIL